MRVPDPWQADAGSGPVRGDLRGLRRARSRARATAVVVLVGALVGCSAPVRPDPPSAPPPPVEVSIPADGVTLKQLGFTNGPSAAFSLPREVVIVTRVDQSSGVTAVFSYPSATELADYLRRTLPRTGFEVSRSDSATATLTFTGYGWRGSFTGDGDSSAVVLRP